MFAEAFAGVGELTDAMEERMEAIERDMAIGEEATAMKKRKGQFERRDGHRGYFEVSGLDRWQLGERMVAAVLPPVSPMMTATRRRNSNGHEVGHCCVTGCIISRELIHRCHTCRRFIHVILCAEPFSNLSEDERYCKACSSIKKK